MEKVTRQRYEEHGVYLLQRMNDGNLLIRGFVVSQCYQQYYRANIEIREEWRYFLKLGSVEKIYDNASFEYKTNNWKHYWATTYQQNAIPNGYMYPGWKAVIKESSLKYCDVDKIQESIRVEDYLKNGDRITRILCAFANNPAIEMYEKAGMESLVRFLVFKEGKTALINRRGKSVKSQLRIKDKNDLEILVKNKGKTEILRILQIKEKNGYTWTEKQIEYLADILRDHLGEEKIKKFLKYMSVQKLINRIEKYCDQKDYSTRYGARSAYYDYLQMREELGYDMRNEVYIYPKSLKQKHDQMVEERRAKQDREYADKKNAEFKAIAKRYDTLYKKYGYTKDGYIIRPAKDAKEIVLEGRCLHHCVGGDNYLRKHNEGKSFILFLRKRETPDIPYYTIEIKGNEVIQWYGIKDTKPDKKNIKMWLDEYVGYLEKSTKKSAVENMMMAAG